MKIMICGSMSFSKDMVETKNKLLKLGHNIMLPRDIDLHLDDSGFVDNLEENFKHCVENDVMRKCFDQVAKSDAVLVLNYKKNGVNGYIGTATLMELGLAHYLGKKIFLLNEIPHFNDARWAHEVGIFQPVVLNGNLELK